MTKIKKLALTRLHVEEDFGFQQLVVLETPRLNLGTDDDGGGEDLPVVQSALDSPFAEALKTKVEAFKTAHEKFDAALKDDTKLPSSAAVTQADEARDFAWRGLSNYVKVLLMHPTAEVVALATSTKDILDKYGNPIDLSQTEESGVLHNLLQDLKAMTQEKRTAMSLDVWIDDLETKEEAFIAAARQRTAEKTGRTVGVIKQKRAAADTAYRELVDTVNALTLLEGDAAYATFIDRVNVLIDQQRTVLKTRTTLNAKKREEAENEGEQGETDSPSVI